MSSLNSVPTSIAGIKHLANKRKKSLGIPYQQALDEAAVAAGFHNFKHARKHLPERREAQPGYLVEIWVGWREYDTRAFGREILQVRLETPLSQLLPKTGFSESFVLSDFVVMSPTRIEAQHMVSDRIAAREIACLMERCLQFMQATGLRPSRAWSRAYPKIGHSHDAHAIPSNDHMRCWYHPATKSYVLSDEPYAPRITAQAEVSREAWCAKHGMQMVRPNWSGMYNPDGDSQLYLIARNSAVELAGLAVELDKLGQPADVYPWRGKSD